MGGFMGCRINIFVKPCAVFIFFILLPFTAINCDKAQDDDLFTIGIISRVPPQRPAFIGLKKGMSGLGYVEGVSVAYIYREIPTDSTEQVVEDEARYLIDQHVDLFIALENDVALQIKRLQKSADIPLIFISNPWPVEYGLVDSMSTPGGNLTGVRLVDTTPKALEWLVTISPGIKKVLLPYCPDDDISMMLISSLKNVPAKLGIDLVLKETDSFEGAIDAIENPSNAVDALFLIPSKILNPKSAELVQAAMKRGIPTCTSEDLDKAALVAFSNDYELSAKQAARLAHIIHSGIKAGGLPVESSEPYLIINIETAEKIGIEIPTKVLQQATKIYR